SPASLSESALRTVPQSQRKRRPDAAFPANDPNFHTPGIAGHYQQRHQARVDEVSELEALAGLLQNLMNTKFNEFEARQQCLIFRVGQALKNGVLHASAIRMQRGQIGR